MNIPQEHRTQTARALRVDTCQAEETGRSAPLNTDIPPLSTERIIAQLIAREVYKTLIRPAGATTLTRPSCLTTTTEQGIADESAP